MCAWFDRGIIMYGDMFCPFHLIMLKPIYWLAFPDAMCEAESTISNEYLFIEEQVFSFTKLYRTSVVIFGLNQKSKLLKGIFGLGVVIGVSFAVSSRLERNDQTIVEVTNEIKQGVTLSCFVSRILIPIKKW